MGSTPLAVYRVALSQVQGMPYCAPRVPFLIDEAGLNELRVQMITPAEFVPSPKDVATLGEAPLRGVSLALAVGWKLDGVRRLAVGSGFAT